MRKIYSVMVEASNDRGLVAAFYREGRIHIAKLRKVGYFSAARLTKVLSMCDRTNTRIYEDGITVTFTIR